MHETALREANNSVLERNRALLQYIATIANSNSKTDEFNYEFVKSLLDGGADINVADEHGQTMFHEVARSWNTDVAHFLLENGKLISNDYELFLVILKILQHSLVNGLCSMPIMSGKKNRNNYKNKKYRNNRNNMNNWNKIQSVSKKNANTNKKSRIKILF